MLDLRGRRVWVAGHGGLVGSAVVKRLQQEDCTTLTVPRSELDLCDQAAVNAWFARNKPEVVIIAAARVGGILANSTYPVDFLRDNLMIETNVLDAAYRNGVHKLLLLGSSCIYPKLAAQPITEDSLLTGPLEPTNEWYALAKIAGVKLCAAYRQQFGCDFISAMPTNLYGLGDNFDLQSSHVLPALMRKIHEAKMQGSPTVEVWGTGTPLREFLYVDDLADAIIFVLQHYSHADPINVGSGQEFSIADLATLIAGIVGYQGQFVFDASKPDGTPRKLLDSSRLHDLGWSSRVTLAQGIAQVYDWFRRQRMPAEGHPQRGEVSA